jgi:F0F1-type ATP synthase assembly protein I
MPERAVWFRYTDAASVGMEMAIAIVICTVGAWWLERNVTHWSPWTTLIGVLIGCIAAGKAIIRSARTYQESLRSQRERESERPRPE